MSVPLKPDFMRIAESFVWYCGNNYYNTCSERRSCCAFVAEDFFVRNFMPYKITQKYTPNAILPHFSSQNHAKKFSNMRIFVALPSFSHFQFPEQL
ncbi:MAG: hypothetical protein EAZ92_01340 [Candidatus Kapaibacterium sp.]|nr:MAG: hypothetical protein EAZ92_01340 [Candidatus Kapabacteria bacterium]